MKKARCIGQNTISEINNLMELRESFDYQIESFSDEKIQQRLEEIEFLEQQQEECPFGSTMNEDEEGD